MNYNFEEIEFQKDLKIYRTKFENLSVEVLKKEFYKNIDVAKFVDTENAGLQCFITTKSNTINLLRENVHKLLLQFTKKDDLFYHYRDWVYISDKNNKKTNYHDHISGPNLSQCKETPTYTLTYYIQMPEDNIGRLWFKKDDKEYSILPKTNDVLFFGSEILHKPETNLKCKKERIVYASNITLIDHNKQFTKSKSSMI